MSRYRETVDQDLKELNAHIQMPVHTLGIPREEVITSLRDLWLHVGIHQLERGITLRELIQKGEIIATQYGSYRDILELCILYEYRQKSPVVDQKGINTDALHALRRAKAIEAIGVNEQGVSLVQAQRNTNLLAGISGVSNRYSLVEVPWTVHAPVGRDLNDERIGFLFNSWLNPTCPLDPKELEAAVRRVCTLYDPVRGKRIPNAELLTGEAIGVMQAAFNLAPLQREYFWKVFDERVSPERNGWTLTADRVVQGHVLPANILSVVQMGKQASWENPEQVLANIVRTNFHEDLGLKSHQSHL